VKEEKETLICPTEVFRVNKEFKRLTTEYFDAVEALGVEDCAIVFKHKYILTESFVAISKTTDMITALGLLKFAEDKMIEIFQGDNGL
jgi:ABC-type microcin C transport system permease subunit YejE